MTFSIVARDVFFAVISAVLHAWRASSSPIDAICNAGLAALAVIAYNAGMCNGVRSRVEIPARMKQRLAKSKVLGRFVASKVLAPSP